MIQFVLQHPEDPLYDMVHLLNNSEINYLLKWSGDDEFEFCLNGKIKAIEENAL